jgi:hypothetical protein
MGDTEEIMKKQTYKQLARHLLAQRTNRYSFRHEMSFHPYLNMYPLVIIGVFTFIVCITEVSFTRGISLIGIGILIGSFNSGFARMRGLRRDSPFTEKVIDWNKVEEMAELDELEHRGAIDAAAHRE